MLCPWVPLFMSILHSRHWQDSRYWGATVNTLDDGSHDEHNTTESEEDEGGFLTMMGRALLFDSMIYIAFFAIFIILLGV